MGYGWDGNEDSEDMVEENIKDTRTSGRARNMENKN